MLPTDPELLAATIFVRPGDPLAGQCPPDTGNPSNGCVLVNHDWVAATFPNASQLNRGGSTWTTSGGTSLFTVTVGYERELMPTLSVSADFVMMRGVTSSPDQLRRADSGWCHPVRRADLLRRGWRLRGRVEDRADTVLYPGGAFDPLTGFPLAGTFINRVLSIESVGQSEYDALNLSIEKRYANNWGGRLSYAFGHSRGNSFEQFGTNGPSLDGVRRRCSVSSTWPRTGKTPRPTGGTS